MVRLTACPGCGAGDITLALRPDLWRCACGLYFESPRPTLEAIRSYYDEGITYRRFAREERVRDFLWGRRLRRVLRYAESGRLLDVGTGDGHFLRLAREHFQVEGTEVSTEGVRLARERGLSVHHGTLAELRLEPEAYDVVTLWHVLEHLPHPAAELERIRSLLVPGGLLVVAVPNEAWPLDRQRFLARRVSPFGPFHPGNEIHLTHFTPLVLERFLGRGGFRVLESGPDDVDTVRSLRSRGREFLRRLVGFALARRWSTAMLAVARVAPPPPPGRFAALAPIFRLVSCHP